MPMRTLGAADPSDDSSHASGRGRLIVSAVGIAKAFPGVQALDAVDLHLRAGEVHALAGENGSGKSTLAKILYGFHQPDSGSIAIDGNRTVIASPREALKHGIVAISQELTLAPTLTVAENIMMGRLPTRAGLVDWRRARRRALEVLHQLGVSIDPDTRVGRLSIELQQEVEVARAVSARSRVLILDEATSSLSEHATERLLEKIEQLRQQGVAVLFISHRLRELYVAAQRATVLRDGKLVGEVPLPQTRERELVRLMVGRDIADLYNKRDVERGETLFKCTGLSTPDGAVQAATLSVRAGEILGVAGLVGCGKTELGLALTGAYPFTGEVELRNRPLTLRSPRSAIRAKIGYVPEDRKRSGLFLTRSVRQNLSYPWLNVLARFGLIDVLRERRLARETVERFSIRTRSLETNITELSGGNQQKVLLGRTLALSPDLVVLSEPTRGVDVGAKSDVYGFIQDIAEAGKAVIVISSELPEILGLADRILVMHHGQIAAEFPRETASEEAVAHAAMAGAVPARELT